MLEQWSGRRAPGTCPLRVSSGTRSSSDPRPWLLFSRETRRLRIALTFIWIDQLCLWQRSLSVVWVRSFPYTVNPRPCNKRIQGGMPSTPPKSSVRSARRPSRIPTTLPRTGDPALARLLAVPASASARTQPSTSSRNSGRISPARSNSMSGSRTWCAAPSAMWIASIETMSVGPMRCAKEAWSLFRWCIVECFTSSIRRPDIFNGRNAIGV